MSIKNLHFLSGLCIAIFVGLHLFNHSLSIFGAEKHIEMMITLRLFYRNIWVEFFLFCAVFVQIVSGLNLFYSHKKHAISFFDKLHIWSGLYLAMFFAIHLSAVLVGRHILKLDTNFYFGVAGLNSFPFYIFFIPYYFFAVVSFFAHITAIHSKKMRGNILGYNPYQQSVFLLATGICFAVFLMYGLTNGFSGYKIPQAYDVLIGK